MNCTPDPVVLASACTCISFRIGSPLAVVNPPRTAGRLPKGVISLATERARRRVRNAEEARKRDLQQKRLDDSNDNRSRHLKIAAEYAAKLASYSVVDLANEYRRTLTGLVAVHTRLAAGSETTSQTNEVF